MFNLAKAVTHRLRRAALRDGPQDRAHHRHRAVSHDHGDVPRDVHEGRPPDGAHLARCAHHRAVHAHRQRDHRHRRDQGRHRGAAENKLEVVREVVAQNQWPLFGATAIGVIAFAAIGLSEDSTGEYTNSLFWVILIALSLSWVSSITVTPLLSYLFFKPVAGGGAAESSDPYGGLPFRIYRKLLDSGAPLPLGRGDPVPSLAFVAALLRLHQGRSELFPAGDPAAIHGGCLPAGRHAHPRDRGVRRRRPAATSRASRGVTHVTSFIGGGGLRFLLVYSPENGEPGLRAVPRRCR